METYLVEIGQNGLFDFVETSVQPIWGYLWVGQTYAKVDVSILSKRLLNENSNVLNKI